MTDLPPRRPPWGTAALVALAVLAGYAATLAPTVTFWDAGEFIAAARVLGIPHPPGTPLFTLIGHTWGVAFPFGEYAQRLNLMSAGFSALCAGFFFLVAHATLERLADGLEGLDRRLVVTGGAAAAAFAGAFAFTPWQNSNETEVYMVATFTIAAISFLVLRWRALRGTPRAAHLLLLVVYIGGLSMGNHLLALLVGPAVVGFLAHTLWTSPAASAEERRREWAQAAVVAGLWALLIGTGLGSTGLVVLGLLCFIAAAAFAATAGTLGFALLAFGLAAVGVTVYLFLYIRAGQQPPLNEADPSTWERLLAVIRREQYPIRTPLDDPTIPHGPYNPGRSLTIIGLQLANYVQYFDWQWARSLGEDFTLSLRSLVTVAFFGLGVHGALAQRRADRGAFWLHFGLWLITGLGLVAYMNFKPGYSLGFDRFPDVEQHEVRDRDYFFLVSFITWGAWVGIGLAEVARRTLVGGGGRLLAGGALAVALVPFAFNFTAASRRHGPDARLAADAAFNLLNSVGPNGILFTYGDNDTFPLWWAQEVQGIRRDVTVVCLSLANTDWYVRQLRDQPPRPFDRAAAPGVWRDVAPVPDRPVHTMTDAEILRARPQQLPAPMAFRAGSLVDTLPAGTILQMSDIVALRIVMENLGRRPIAWAITTGGERAGLGRWTIQQGLAFRLEGTRADTTRTDLDFTGIAGAPLDVELSRRLAWETYRYADLLEAPPGAVTDPTSRSFSNSLGLVLAQLGFAYEREGNLDAARENFRRAAALNPNPAIVERMNELDRGVFAIPGADTLGQ
ncbi:MAG TPA: DUF2723 domain-containing protein [Gemmatimonadales bacterium]|nr:DUF2723 domain-containing protein [Gemmatimonadales bacterium]